MNDNLTQLVRTIPGSDADAAVMKEISDLNLSGSVALEAVHQAETESIIYTCAVSNIID